MAIVALFVLTTEFDLAEATRSIAQESPWTYRLMDFPNSEQAGQQRPVITALAATGDWLAAGGDDHRIWFWNPQDPRCLGAAEAHRDWVRCLASPPDGSILASGGNDGLVLLWDPIARRRLNTIRLGAGAVTGLAFHESGDHLFVACFDGQVVLTRVSDGHILRRRQLPDRDLRAIAPLGSLSRTAVAGRSGTIYLWSAVDDQLQVVAAHRSRVRSLCWSEEKATLYSAGEDGRILAWSWPLSNQPRLVAQLPAPINSMIEIPNGIVVGCSDNTLRVVDPVQGKVLAELGDHTGSVSVLAASADGGFFSAGYDTTLRKWQLSLTTSTSAREGCPAP